MMLLIAILAAVTLGHRRTPLRAASLTTAALVAIGLGCGSQETPDPEATTLAESDPTLDLPLPAPGRAHVEYSDGLVTVRSNGSLQLAILEQLAAQAGFEIVVGKTEARPITLQIDRASLVAAIDLILVGFTYTLGYEFGKESGTRILTRVEIDGTLKNDAARLAKTAPANAPQIPDRAPSAATRAGEGTRGDPMELDGEQAELLSDLDSPDPETRADAADWIDLDGPAFERMASLLESDPDEDVRATIADRLGEEGSPEAIAALVAALRDPNSEVVLIAIEALAFEGGAWLIPELERLLSHRDPEVREDAEDAIGFLAE